MAIRTPLANPAATPYRVYPGVFPPAEKCHAPLPGVFSQLLVPDAQRLEALVDRPPGHPEAPRHLLQVPSLIGVKLEEVLTLELPAQIFQAGSSEDRGREQRTGGRPAQDLLHPLLIDGTRRGEYQTGHHVPELPDVARPVAHRERSQRTIVKSGRPSPVSDKGTEMAHQVREVLDALAKRRNREFHPA